MSCGKRTYALLALSPSVILSAPVATYKNLAVSFFSGYSPFSSVIICPVGLLLSISLFSWKVSLDTRTQVSEDDLRALENRLRFVSEDSKKVLISGLFSFSQSRVCSVCLNDLIYSARSRSLDDEFSGCASCAFFRSLISAIVSKMFRLVSRSMSFDDVLRSIGFLRDFL